MKFKSPSVFLHTSKINHTGKALIAGDNGVFWPDIFTISKKLKKDNEILNEFISQYIPSNLKILYKEDTYIETININSKRKYLLTVIRDKTSLNKSIYGIHWETIL